MWNIYEKKGILSIETQYLLCIPVVFPTSPLQIGWNVFGHSILGKMLEKPSKLQT